MKPFHILSLFAVLFYGACQQTSGGEPVPFQPTPGASVMETEYREVLVTGAKDSSDSYVDGALREARFGQIADLVFDAQGNFYVADASNNVIRYVDLEKKQVSTFAGERYTTTDNMPASEIYRNGSLASARFSTPRSLALAADGTLYVADYANHKVRKIANGQVSTLLGDSPQNRPPGEKPDLDYPLRQSGSLSTATVFLPAFLKMYNERYLFLYESYSTNRYIDLEKQVILGAVETFGSESQIEANEKVDPKFQYADFGDVTSIVFDQNGANWGTSLADYAVRYRSISGKHIKSIGDNETTLIDGFTGYRWSVVQKDGDFENFSFRSVSKALQGHNPDYLFVHDRYRNSTDKALRTSSLRLVDLNKKYVSTVPGVQDFDDMFVDPNDEMYVVRGHAIYRIEPSPVKVLTSGETR